MKLNLLARKLPKGYLVNNKGAICKQVREKQFYCGRAVMRITE
jgi:hypothetical protein